MWAIILDEGTTGVTYPGYTMLEPDVDTRDLERSQPEYGRQQHI